LNKGPRNPFLADSSNPIANGRCDQQDNQPIRGPEGPTETLSGDDIQYTWLGPGHFGSLISGPYADGKRVLWSNGREQIAKLDYDTLEVLATLPGVKTLNATASADQAEFFLEFDWGYELDIVRMQVSEKVDQVKADLPPDIGEVVIFSFNTSDIPVVEARISAQGVDLSESYELIEARILNRIRRVPGVARVTLDGVAPKEIGVGTIYRSVIPFIILQLAGLTLVFAWQEIVTWLPSVAYGQ